MLMDNYEDMNEFLVDLVKCANFEGWINNETLERALNYLEWVDWSGE